MHQLKDDMSFAPSFYHFDRADKKAAEIKLPTVPVVEEPELDLQTAVEPTPMKYIPVYSTYLHAGMAWNPAYNSLPSVPKEEKPKVTITLPPVVVEKQAVEAIPADYFLHPLDKKKKEKQPAKESETIPADYFLRRPEKQEPPKEYKNSMYLGFQDNSTPAYFPRPEKNVAVAESRLVQPIKVANDLPQPKIKLNNAQSTKLTDDLPRAELKFKKDIPEVKTITLETKRTVEGEAFLPAKMPAVSEYQFGKLNDLVSFIDLKH